MIKKSFYFFAFAAIIVLTLGGCTKYEGDEITVNQNGTNNNTPGGGTDSTATDSSTMCGTLPWYLWAQDQVYVYVWHANWHVSPDSVQFDWDGDPAHTADGTAYLPPALRMYVDTSLAGNPNAALYFSMRRKLFIQSQYCPQELLSYAILSAQRMAGGRMMPLSPDDVFVRASRGETPWMKR